MKIIFFILTLACLSAVAAEKDSVNTTHNTATLTVTSKVSGVKVFLDSLLLGITPLENVCLHEGNHILCFIHPDGRSWFHPALIESLVVHPDEHIERVIQFPSLYYITSTPYGSTVIYNDSVIGMTPLTFSTHSSINFIKLSRNGFEEEIVPLPSDGGGVHVNMRSREQLNSKNSSLFLSNNESKNYLPIYITTGTAVVSGVTSAYFKIKADGYYNEYRETNNPATLDKVKRFDIIAGVSLMVSEISLLFLTTILLSR